MKPCKSGENLCWLPAFVCIPSKQLEYIIFWNSQVFSLEPMCKRNSAQWECQTNDRNNKLRTMTNISEFEILSCVSKPTFTHKICLKIPPFFIVIVVRWGNLVLNLNSTFWLISLSALIAYMLVMNRFHGKKLQAN